MKSDMAAAFFLCCSILFFSACEIPGESSSGFNPVQLKRGVSHSETTTEFQREFKFIPAGSFSGSVVLNGLSSNWNLYLFDSSQPVYDSDFSNGEFNMIDSYGSSENPVTAGESISYYFVKDVTYYFVITEEDGTSPSSFTIAVP